MSGYDVTQHLDYKIAPAAASASSGAAASGLPPLHSVRLRAVGAPPPADSERLASAALAAYRGELRPGVRVGGTVAAVVAQFFVAVVACDPPQGGYFDPAATTLTVDTQPLPTLARIHILPYLDAKPPNRNLTINEFAQPFFAANSVTMVAVDFEFGHGTCRFRVVGCDPAGPAVVGPETEVFWEGEPIQRRLLKEVAVLPYSHTLPRVAPGGAPPDLFRDYIRPYFAQRSAPLHPADEFEFRGVRFRVVKCEPPGGGPCKDTIVHTNGPALTACGVTGCASLATQRCAEPACGKVLCKSHATKAAKEGGGERTLCQEHAPGAGCTTM